MFQAPGISMTIQGNGTVVVAATHLLHNRLLPDRADTFFGFFILMLLEKKSSV
jgi:hypothetical protein